LPVVEITFTKMTSSASAPDAASDAAVDGDTFTLFPKLAPELRLKIWEEASFLPRDLDIFCIPMGIITMGLIEDEDEEPEDHFTPFRFVSSQAVAPILHVSSEARRVGLKHYKPWFTVDYDFRSFAFSTPPHVYYNNVSDRICFHGHYIEGSDKEIWACIRGYEAKRLAINVNNIGRENIADGTRGVEMVCDLPGWLSSILLCISTRENESTLSKLIWQK
jgi:hypothetical protein